MPLSCDVPESALIVVASSDPAIPNRKLTGTIQERSNKSITLITDEKIAESAAVRVHSKDLVSFGAVLRSGAEPNATWTVQVQVNRSMLVV
jgi:hypothetical protein